MAIVQKSRTFLKQYCRGLCSAGRHIGRAVFFLAAAASLAGCASTSGRQEVVALVDGFPIAADEVMYSVSIAHRREGLAKTQALDLGGYVQKLIDDRLIIDEARRRGMEDFPSVRRSVKDFVLRESVVMLHKEEVLSKIVISPDDIINNYKENYLKYGFIELNSQDEADSALQQLKDGADFTELSRKYSTSETQRSGEGVVVNRANLVPAFKDALAEAGPGGHTSVVRDKEKYYILQLLSVSETDKVFQERLRAEIEKGIRKQKGLGADFLKELRSKAPVMIDDALLAGIIRDMEAGGREKWTHDQTSLVRVYDAVLTVEQFVIRAWPEKGNVHKKAPVDAAAVIDNWINVQLVDHEALSRRYDLGPELEARVFNYTNQILKRLFLQSVVAAGIDLSEEKVKDFYSSNLTRYMFPARYRVQTIGFDAREEAEAALKALKAGTDFDWLAKTKSGPMKEQQADTWWTAGEVPEALQEGIDAISPGGMGPIFEHKGKYNIVLLKEKVKEKPKDFEAVREQVKKDYFQQKSDEKLEEFLAQLRKEADIVIYEDAIRKLEERFSR